MAQNYTYSYVGDSNKNKSFQNNKTFPTTRSKGDISNIFMNLLQPNCVDAMKTCVTCNILLASFSETCWFNICHKKRGPLTRERSLFFNFVLIWQGLRRVSQNRLSNFLVSLNDESKYILTVHFLLIMRIWRNKNYGLFDTSPVQRDILCEDLTKISTGSWQPTDVAYRITPN